jgi:hypothetical protein
LDFVPFVDLALNQLRKYFGDEPLNEKCRFYADLIKYTPYTANVLYNPFGIGSIEIKAGLVPVFNIHAEGTRGLA